MPVRILLSLALAILIAAACSADDADAGSTVIVEDRTTDDAPADDAAPADDGATAESSQGASADGNADDEGLAPSPDPVPLGDQVGEVTVVGDPLDVMPPRIPVTEPANDPAIGQRAPEISGTDFSGSPVEIVADGTPKVIMFVAHWCPHCQREIPAVKALIDAGAVPDGLELVVVSTAVRDEGDNFPPQTWLQDEGWPGPIMRDSEGIEALVAFGVGGFPFSVYLDADHEVVTRSAGQIPTELLQQLWLATADG